MLHETTHRLKPISDSTYWWLSQLIPMFVLDNPPIRRQADDSGIADRKYAAPWFESVMDELCRLPSNPPAWSSEQPKPLNVDAVAELMHLLIEVMPEHGTPPQTSPNWDGGVVAVSELGDLCLEIETTPDRPAQYCYIDERNGMNFGEEGNVSGNEENLRTWLRHVADAIAQANR